MIYKNVLVLRDASVQPPHETSAVDLETLAIPADYCYVYLNFDNSHLVGKATNFFHAKDGIICDIEIPEHVDGAGLTIDTINELELQPCAGVMVGKARLDDPIVKDCKLISIGLANPNIDPGIKPLKDYAE